MSIDLEPRDGHWQFRIGPVERWIVGLVAAAVVGGTVLLGNSVLSRLDELSKAQTELAKQQAVANQQLVTLNMQLANVPQLAERVGRNEVRIESLERWRERAGDKQ